MCTTLQVQTGTMCQWRTDHFLQPEHNRSQSTSRPVSELCPTLQDPDLTLQHLTLQHVVNTMLGAKATSIAVTSIIVVRGRMSSNDRCVSSGQSLTIMGTSQWS